MLPSQMLAMVELLFTDLVYRLTRLYHVCDTEACGIQRSGGKAVEGSTFEFHQLAWPHVLSICSLSPDPKP